MATWTHESSYGRWPESVVHRARLRAILAIVEHIDLPDVGRVADFGCSDGFVLAQLARGLPEGWGFVGFDHNRDLLRAARTRELPRSRFRFVDLNRGADAGLPRRRFDLCVCLETLEHTGDFRRAVRAIFPTCRRGGWLLLSCPVEKRAPGLAKLLVRPVVRRHPYGTFFDGRSRVSYAWAVATGGDLERFRRPPRAGWGPHLGFDVDRFEQFLHAELLVPGRAQLVHVHRTFFGFNRLYLLRRIA